MDTITIKQCIQDWVSIRESAVTINEKFEQGNCFSYSVPPSINTSEEIHVYPGLLGEQLLFFVIPAEYDTADYDDVIGNYTAVCPVQFAVGGGNDHEITEAEAHARILAWEDYHETWVPLQIATADGMFEAFSVAVQDFESKDVVMTLGLKESKDKGIYLADLIVTNDKSDVLVYDDFVRSVPPFDSATAMAQQNFYLLPPPQ